MAFRASLVSSRQQMQDPIIRTLMAAGEGQGFPVLPYLAVQGHVLIAVSPRSGLAPLQHVE